MDYIAHDPIENTREFQEVIGEAIKKGKKKYSELSKESQCRVILQILQISSIGNLKADLSLIGGAAMMGNMRINKEITKNEKFLLIHQSVTGLFEDKIIDLKTV